MKGLDAHIQGDFDRNNPANQPEDPPECCKCGTTEALLDDDNQIICVRCFEKEIKGDPDKRAKIMIVRICNKFSITNCELGYTPKEERMP